MPLLTDEQLIELERQLVAAEQEGMSQIGMRSIRPGPAQENLIFKAQEYIRRLLEDVKTYRQSVKQPNLCYYEMADKPIKTWEITIGFRASDYEADELLIEIAEFMDIKGFGAVTMKTRLPSPSG